ncbi:MAG: hypothetical protein ACP5HM_04770 [Anaerolineae bacterium]
MGREDLLQYLREHVVERLTQEEAALTEAEARAWFDALLETWAARPSDAPEATVDEASSQPHLEVHFETETEDEGDAGAEGAPVYEPPPLKGARQPDAVELWMRTAYLPWPDRPLEHAVQVFARRRVYAVPRPPLTHTHCRLGWRHLRETEARALAFELHRAGVDVQTLVGQIEAFPSSEITLAWLAEPERSLQMHLRLLAKSEAGTLDGDATAVTRLHHNVEFIGRLMELIPSHVRSRLQGWHAALLHPALAHAVGLEADEPHGAIG